MRRCTWVIAALAGFMLAALPPAASAQSFRCVGKDGKKYYGQVVPQACIGQPYEQLNRQGMVIKRIEPYVKEEDPAAKAAAEKKAREKEIARKEEARRARALLATYTSTKEIEGARSRALAPIKRQIRNIKQDIAELHKQIAHMGKKKGSDAESGIKSAQSQIEIQKSLLDFKNKEADAINARYDEDKKLFIELTGRK